MTRPILLILGLLVASAAADGQCVPSFREGLGRAEPTGAVYDLSVLPVPGGELLLAAGAFMGSVSDLTPQVGAFDGERWTAFGNGPFGGTAFSIGRAVALYDHGTGPALYAAGQRSQGLFQPVLQTVARFDGAAWTTIGSSDFGVTALHVHDDGSGPALYAAGGFTQMNGVAASGLARWNGSAWSAVGTTALGVVTALCTHPIGGTPRLVAGHAYAAGGGTSAVALSVWDGIAWSPLGSGVTGSVYRSIQALESTQISGASFLVVGGTFSTIDGVAAENIAYHDGAAFHPVAGGLYGTSVVVVTSLAFFDDGTGWTLYAAGQFHDGSGAILNNIAKLGPTGWTPLGTGTSARVEDLVVHAAPDGAWLYAGGPFETAGGVPARHLARWSSGGWSRIAPGEGLDGGYAHAFAPWQDQQGNGLIVGGNFHAAGNALTPSLAIFDGRRFFPLVPTPQLGEVRALARGAQLGSTVLYVGGVSLLGRYDGTTWTAMGGVGGSNPYVNALLEVPAGAFSGLYAGGWFTSLGGVQVSGVAHWSGTSWSALGAGFNHEVKALVTFDDGTGPAVYAAGNFTASGAASVQRVARWTGGLWAGLGSGFDGEVQCLAVHDDGFGPALYAGGQFYNSGTTPVSRIARWDGTAWNPVGGGMSGSYLSGLPSTVSALASFDDGTGLQLYAGGTFTTAGGSPIPFLARWNGFNWSPVDAGLNGPVYALASHDAGDGGSLQIGGAFGRAGSIPSAYFGLYGPRRPILRLFQTGGAGTGVSVENRFLVAGGEYANVFSLDLCAGGPGGGPFLGLCALDPGSLVAQLLLPVGAVPFRFLASADTHTFGPYPVPVGVPLEGVCLDVTGGSLGCFSPVVRFAAQ